MVESAHTDWGGDLYKNTFKRWGMTKVGQIMDGTAGTQTAEPFGAENRMPYNMRVMELDLSVVNDLGAEVTLRRTKDDRPQGAETTAAASDKDRFRLSQEVPVAKILTRDGEVWQAEWSVNDRKRSTKFTVDFRWGVFQEIYLSEIAAGRQKSGAPQLMRREELEQLKARELKSLLEDRGLDTRGKKTALVERLLQAGATM